MRNPFRKMPRGMTKATSANRRHRVFKNKLAARMLVMKSTQLDRMPMHSCATSMVMFGSWKNSARPKKRRAAEMEKKIGYFSRGRFRSRLERIFHRIRHRHHENEVG